MNSFVVSNILNNRKLSIIYIVVVGIWRFIDPIDKWRICIEWANYFTY